MKRRADEAAVIAEIASRRDELVAIACDLIAFDTTARDRDDPPRDEAHLQGYLATRLEAAGADIELWEPSPDEMARTEFRPSGLSFDGRPQLVARFRGAKAGRSLLLNGHIDAVSPEPRDAWSSDPFRAEVRNGRLYGRGACDMKGGIAAMSLAAEVLALLGIRLAGDLVVSTNTDEESSGAGGMALVAHGVGADAGIVPEPTGFNAWIACRGSNYLTIDVPGRPGHAEIAQPHWRDGGAVNAIEKASIVLGEIGQIRQDWQLRPELQHRLLPTSDIIPTMAAAGEWGSTYPSSYRILCVVPYVPAHADLDGWSRRIQNEVNERIATAAAHDDWLADNPPILSWSASTGPMEIAPDEEIIATVLRAGAAVGRSGTIQGLSSWFDGATFTRAGTPTIAFGPSGRDDGRVVPHTIDEFVPVDDLVTCAQALALTAMRFCGVQSPR